MNEDLIEARAYKIGNTRQPVQQPTSVSVGDPVAQGGNILTTMPLPRPGDTASAWLKIRKELQGKPADSPDAANGGDPILTTLLQSISAPPSVQLPAQFGGGRAYVTPAQPGNPAGLWILLAVVGGAGLWWFKFRKGA